MFAGAQGGRLVRGRAPRQVNTVPVMRRASNRGFTLLELLVAVTLMAILALLGWRGLDALLGARDRISRAGDDLRATSVVFAQVEEDLRRAWPVRLINSGRQPVLLSGLVESAPGMAAGARLDVIREAPALAALGADAGTGDPLARRTLASGLQRVIWRVDGGRLERGFFAWWWTLDTGQSGDIPDGMTWQSLLDGVESIGWRLFVPGVGWLRAGVPPAETQSVTGVEVTIVRAGERLVRVFSVRD